MNKSTLPIGFWKWLFDVTDGGILLGLEFENLMLDFSTKDAKIAP